jgi:hypothetical protein
MTHPVGEVSDTAGYAPPLTDSTWPVIQDAWSEAKKQDRVGDVRRRAEAAQGDALDQPLLLLASWSAKASRLARSMGRWPSSIS